MPATKALHAFLLAGVLAVPVVGAAKPQLLVLEPCALPGFEGTARCGTLDVPENPALPEGRRLGIAVAVLPATGGKALPDPLVPLMGGPGEDALSAAGLMTERAGDLRRDRDVLLVDQRGTGRSSALRCRLLDPEDPAQSLRDMMPPAAVAGCARELARDADLTQYTYLHFARDLEAVRAALGYGKLNLVAGSYGTRAAQVFLRAYPGSVRTVFFGSVVPIDVIPPLTMARASQSMFESTFEACAAETACRAAYPGLREEFAEVLDRLDAGEVRVSVQGSPAPIARGRFVEWLRGRLYRPGSAATVPRLIHEAHAGRWSSIADEIIAQAREIDTAYGLGLFFSITCAEDVAFIRDGDIEAESAGTFLGDYRVRQQQAACAQWPLAQLPAGYRDAVSSAVPAMFLSGDLDAATPLWFTGRVAAGFPNRAEVIARGQGHTEWSPCIGGLYRQFVDSGSAGAIDPGACPPIPRPPFEVD